jgi:hypothetical protein
MAIEDELKQSELEAKRLEILRLQKELNSKKRLDLAGAAVLVTILGGLSAVVFQGIGLRTALSQQETAHITARSEFDFKGLELFLREQDHLFGCDPDEALRNLTLFKTLFSEQITSGFSGIISYRTQNCLARLQNAAVLEAGDTATLLEVRAAADEARYSAAVQQSALLEPAAGSSESQHRVLIQIGSEADHAAASGLQAALVRAGYAAPGVELVAAAPFNYQVRYYYKDQAEDAQKLASFVTAELGLEASGGVRIIPLEGRYGSLPKGTMEFWFPNRNPDPATTPTAAP